MRPSLASTGFLIGVSVAGMPYPKNLQTAMEVEAIVRENGAVPATIAILNGVPHVGKLYRAPSGRSLDLKMYLLLVFFIRLQGLTVNS